MPRELKSILASILLGLALITPGLSLAEPSVNTVFKHYKIYPESKQDFQTELFNRSSINKEGRTFFGHTNWRVEWRFRWTRKNGKCRINQVTTSLDVTYTMPQIPEQHEVDTGLRASFESYYQLLLAHEQEHMKSGLYAAREIEDTLLNLGSFDHCDRLNDEANASGHRLIKKYNRRDIEYDRRTNHGRTEGVDIRNFM